MVASSDWAYDIENEYMVAGAADTVIAGTVLAEIIPSDTRMAPNPETQFTVRVDSILKGDAPEEIVVSQLGGFSPEKNAFIMSGDDPLMEVGGSYVMSLVFDPAVTWYTASPATNGIEVISTAAEGAPQRRGEAESDVVSRMRDVVANEIPPQPAE
ncbi:hypothetical protein BJI47_00670 [Rhodococcus sp. 1168]|nr:hypothetical protein BJI47_00670 [Rhodococcus sp. 1168]